MHFNNAIDTIAKAVSHDFSSLPEVLSSELIDACLEKPPRRHCASVA